VFAFAIVWAITQLVLSPGTSASDAPASASVVSTSPAPAVSVSQSRGASADPPQAARVDVPPITVPLAPSPDNSPVKVPDQTARPTSASQPVAPPAAHAPARLTVLAGTNTELSKALAARVLESLRGAGVSPQTGVIVSLEMSTRPS